MEKIWSGLGTKVGGWLMNAGLLLMGERSKDKKAETSPKTTDNYEISDEDIFVILEVSDEEVNLRGFIGTRDQAVLFRSRLKGVVVMLENLLQFREKLIAHALKPQGAKTGWETLLH